MMIYALNGEWSTLIFLLFVPQQDRLPKEHRGKKQTHNEFIKMFVMLSLSFSDHCNL